jgi:hypothetical protein
MDATIRSSCSNNLNSRSGNAGERGLEGILDRAAAGLGLPAEEAAAVVFEP